MSASHHPLLVRQLRRSLGPEPAQQVLDGEQGIAGEALARLLAMVSQNYAQADRDLALHTRSLELSSYELREANDRLLADAARQQKVLDSLLESVRELRDDAAAAVPGADGAEPAERGLLELAHSLHGLLARRREHERELAKARDAAEEASRAKTRFLANMSHELRTPLNAVIGAAQLLATGGGDGDARGHLVEAIHKSGMNLLGLIENILDVSRIEAGELRLVPADFHLLDCIDAALATVSVAARAKGLSMACIVDPGLAPWRHGDGLRLRQILLNLLGNAVKFTAAGDVVLRVGPGAGPGDLALSVSDTGVGIRADLLPVIFEPFRQADDGSSRRFGGSGLGLSIVHQLVAAMHGRIEVQSTPGVGTCFELLLRLPAAEAAPQPPSPLHTPIAFYEPHEPSAQALGAQLQRLGCPHQRVADGQALRRWLVPYRRTGVSPWVLVASDEPVAWSLLEAAADAIDPERVIGMTRAETVELEWARDACRLSRNIIKPVLRSALVSRLGVARQAAAPPPVTLPAALDGTDSSHPLTRLLVVEDDPLNQTIISRMLIHAGCQVTMAADGAQALALLSADRFDLVLMDWQMPDMDGLEVTRCIRAGRAGALAQKLPIIALTANAFAEDRAACLAAGMNDFLTKPVLADRLLAAVQRWRPPPSADTRPDTTPVTAPVTTPPMTMPHAPTPPTPAPATAIVDDEHECFDPSVLASLPMVADGSDPGYADELLQAFREAARKACDEVDAALASGDAAALQRRVHTLKSNAAQVGAAALAAEAARQETALRRGAPPDPAGAVRLRRALAAFERAVQGHAAAAGSSVPSTVARSPG